MLFNEKELGIMFQAVTFTGELNQQGFAATRSFPITELKAASEVAANVLELAVDDQFPEGDHELELDTAQKTLVIKCLNRNWQAVQGAVVLSIQEKLA